jgi:cyclic pyranopterin phosphate synthase
VGKLHLCLFGDNGVELRDLLAADNQQDALQQRIRAALTGKAASHRLHEGNAGMTPNLASIGG